jgi:hypothetical protein
MEREGIIVFLLSILQRPKLFGDGSPPTPSPPPLLSSHRRRRSPSPLRYRRHPLRASLPRCCQPATPHFPLPSPLRSLVVGRCWLWTSGHQPRPSNRQAPSMDPTSPSSDPAAPPPNRPHLQVCSPWPLTTQTLGQGLQVTIIVCYGSPDLLPQVSAAVGRPSPSSRHWGNGTCHFRLVGRRPRSPLLLLALLLGHPLLDPAGVGSFGLGCACLLGNGVDNSARSLGLGSGVSATMGFCPTLSRSPPA